MVTLIFWMQSSKFKVQTAWRPFISIGRFFWATAHSPEELRVHSLAAHDDGEPGPGPWGLLRNLAASVHNLLKTCIEHKDLEGRG